MPQISIMLRLNPSHFDDYELIDAGEGEKIERFGPWVLIRPEPQAIWKKAFSPEKWKSMAHVCFIPDGGSGGTWQKLKPEMPDQWLISYQNKGLKLKFRLGLTGFKHVGIFPEQASNWDFIFENTRKIKNPKILNLFAYTGGASLAARAAGADVIHCDSIKQVVNWANENMNLSGLTDVRWLVEDAFKFVKKEAAKGKIYQGIILDPPAWGHGPKGEKWKLEEMIAELMEHVAALLDERKHFLVFNAYSLGYSPMLIENLVLSTLKIKRTQVESGELYVPDQSGRNLPGGIFCRSTRGLKN